MKKQITLSPRGKGYIVKKLKNMLTPRLDEIITEEEAEKLNADTSIEVLVQK